jgi:hypothetical protein
LKQVTRRELLRRVLRMGALLPFAPSAILDATTRRKHEAARFTPLPGQPAFTTEDEALLQEIVKANFRYFWEQANPETGIVRDRCNVIKEEQNPPGSTAAVGFGLTALCIGEKRGLVSHSDARDRVLNTLRFLWKKLPNHRGFFYHWANVDTGERLWDSEVRWIPPSCFVGC